MTGANRVDATGARRAGLIPRPRLTQILRGRFDHRLTLVTGPGGAGKTTALALALDDNRLDPFGIDVWCTATEHDGDPEHLATAIATALDAFPGPDAAATVQAITDAVWTRAPRDVALVIDDVHLVTGLDSQAVLAGLLDGLPANGHLVLAGRSQPALTIARLRAHGEVVELAATDLTFDDDELAALIRTRVESSASGVEASELPRLPALADLRLRAGPGADTEFLWEEVLSSIDEERRLVLQRAAVARVVDDAVVAALSAGPRTAADLVAGLPLVEPAADGSFRFHTLLRDALRQRLDTTELRDAARAVAAVELDRGDLRAAVELLRTVGDDADALATARRFALLPAVRRTFESQLVVRNIVDQLAPGSALADLLRAESQFGELSTTTDMRRLGDEVAATAERARREGEPEVEAAARYRSLVWLSLDGPYPDDSVARFEELALTVPFAAQMARFVRAERDMFRGNPRAALAHLAPVSDGPVDPDLEFVGRAGVLCSLGRPEDVGVGLTTSDLAGMPDGADLYVGFALWTRGQLTPEVALPIALSMTAQTLARRVVHPIVGILGVTSFMALAAGDLATAERHVTQARAEATFGCSAHIRAFTAMADAATLLTTDGEVAAAERLGRMLEVIPIGDWPIRAYLLGLPMLYLLRPETRPTLDRAAFGPALTAARDAGRALVELRTTGGRAGAAALPWDREACLRAHVLPVHLGELAVAAAIEGSPDAPEILDRLPDRRAVLERVASVSSSAVAAAAATHLAAIPGRPLQQVRVHALGPLEILRDDAVVTDPDWARRTRVRELMALLVEQRRVRRPTAAALLWPDLDPDRALRNLRVTLSYLQRVLEPARPARTEPAVVRTDADELAVGADVEIDVDEFEAEMARALEHDRAGAPGAALQRYTSALASHRGDYLDGLDAPWAAATRTRLHLLALSGILRVGELELASGEPDRAASWAMRAVALSPGNERAVRLLAACFAAVGDRIGAARVLRDLVIDLRADRVAPDAETLRLLDRFVDADAP